MRVTFFFRCSSKSRVACIWWSGHDPETSTESRKATCKTREEGRKGADKVGKGASQTGCTSALPTSRALDIMNIQETGVCVCVCVWGGGSNVLSRLHSTRFYLALFFRQHCINMTSLIMYSDGRTSLLAYITSKAIRAKQAAKDDSKRLKEEQKMLKEQGKQAVKDAKMQAKLALNQAKEAAKQKKYAEKEAKKMAKMNEALGHWETRHSSNGTPLRYLPPATCHLPPAAVLHTTW